MKIKIPIKIQVEWNIGFYETRSSNLLWYTTVQPAWHVENFLQIKVDKEYWINIIDHKSD